MSTIKKFREIRRSIWLWSNFPTLSNEIRNHLAAIMALAELSERNDKFYPKLSEAALKRCPLIVGLLHAAKTDDPKTFERNNRYVFTDTPPNYSSYDNAISFWPAWLNSVEKYPYRIPVPNHLSEAHKWFCIAQSIDPTFGSALVARTEALMQPEQLQQARLKSEAFLRDYRDAHPSA